MVNFTYVHRRSCPRRLLGPCSQRKAHLLRRRSTSHLNNGVKMLQMNFFYVTTTCCHSVTHPRPLNCVPIQRGALCRFLLCRTISNIPWNPRNCLDPSGLGPINEKIFILELKLHNFLYDISLLVRKLEGIPRLRVSSRRASLWLPFSRPTLELGWDSMHAIRLEYRRHQSFLFHRNHRYRRQILRLLVEGLKKIWVRWSFFCRLFVTRVNFLRIYLNFFVDY